MEKQKVDKPIPTPIEIPQRDVPGEEEQERERMSKARKSWLCFTWAMTWYIPSCCISLCGMKRKEIQIAWREKVTLNLMILGLSVIVIFCIGVLGNLICPKQSNLSIYEVRDQHNVAESAFVYTRGRIYDVTGYSRVHEAFGVEKFYMLNRTAGKDVSSLFPVLPSDCLDEDDPRTKSIDKTFFKNKNLNTTKALGDDILPHENPALALEAMKPHYVGKLVWMMKEIEKMQKDGTMALKTYKNEVFDFTPLFGIQSKMLDIFLPGFGARLLDAQSRIDITSLVDSVTDAGDKKQTLRCMRGLLKVGEVDTRDSFKCQFTNYAMLFSTGVLVLVILFKFLASLQFGSKPSPEDCDRFVICQVPCYTEDTESLKRTIDSLAALRYDDKRKLLFVICDGMIMGSGNDRPTPELVLDILGISQDEQPPAIDYVALGDGVKQHNRARLYSGLYEITGHVVPYIVVVKVGAKEETARPGNRGKRDSQILLMRFLNRVHYNKPMNPLELEIYHQMKHIVGVDPSFYEYVLMVDADTVVLPDSLNRMVSVCTRDSTVMGLCGETKIANEKDSFITMIQVYEYFISHHMAKAFESLFGTVTCLPGCFCMYRIKAPNETPLLINNCVVGDYSENRVDTLHVKNLLSLGEDRYLTTLMLKHFPKYRLIFTSDARCETHVPDKWSVLLSQRRRWINSTVHNLAELMFLDQLCGFCCFSMRFVVMLDLFATLVMPATLVYLVYLIYLIVLNESQLPFVSLMLLVAAYSLQAVIFIVRGEYQHFGSLIIYILALPIFSFYLPLYAFWHFDDFSWGNTRVVTGEKQKQVYLADVKKFDPSSIPHKTWSEYEKGLLQEMDCASNKSDETKSSVSSCARSKTSSAPDYFLNKKISGRNMQAGNVTDDALLLSVTGSNHGRNRGPRSVCSMSNITATPNTINPLLSSGYHQQLYMNHMAPAAPVEPLTPHSPVMPVAPVIRSPNDFPTDAEIQAEVYRILSGADLTVITKKKIREELSAFFNVNLSHRKEFINQVINNYLRSM
jgi:chitin synthase